MLHKELDNSMKKSYKKPVIAFEPLALSDTVSSGCWFLNTNNAERICPIIDEESGWTIFSDYANCMMMPGPNDSICYDVPIANSNVFAS